MIQTDGLNILLAWVFFGILLATLAWLLLRSGQDDALSSVVRSAVDAPGTHRGADDRPAMDARPEGHPGSSGGSCAHGDLPGRPAA